MARVTIEDCLEKVEDRFELVAIAGQRARNIASGSALTIERKGEKDTVISLREIAEGTVEIDVLKKDLIKSHQKEKDSLEDFAAPHASNNNDNIEIDLEEAEIAAAIAEASEANLEQDEALGDGFNSAETPLGDDN